MMARVFGSTRAVIDDLGERPKYFDEMLKLFLHSCFSAERWKAFKEGREVVYELQFLRVGHPFWLLYQSSSMAMVQACLVAQELALAKELSLSISHQEFTLDFLSTVIDRLVLQELMERLSRIDNIPLTTGFGMRSIQMRH